MRLSADTRIFNEVLWQLGALGDAAATVYLLVLADLIVSLFQTACVMENQPDHSDPSYNQLERNRHSDDDVIVVMRLHLN